MLRFGLGGHGSAAACIRPAAPVGRPCTRRGTSDEPRHDGLHVARDARAGGTDARGSLSRLPTDPRQVGAAHATQTPAAEDERDDAGDRRRSQQEQQERAEPEGDQQPADEERRAAEHGNAPPREFAARRVLSQQLPRHSTHLPGSEVDPFDLSRPRSFQRPGCGKPGLQPRRLDASVATMAKRDLPEDVVTGVVILLVLGLVFAAGFFGFFLGRDSKHARNGETTTVASATVDPTIASGAHLFVQFGCVQCHGMQGRGGVSPYVPALTGAGSLTAARLRSIINHGLGESQNPTKPYMPVWGAVISDRQVSDLVSYIHAGLPEVATASPLPVPQGQGAAVQGATLYVNYGCINCHGPNGLGGVPNPESPDKSIPPLSGPVFRSEFNTEAKILAVIHDGSVIGRAPIVSMPHWGGVIPPAQLQALVAYLDTLK